MWPYSRLHPPAFRVGWRGRPPPASRPAAPARNAIPSERQYLRARRRGPWTCTPATRSRARPSHAGHSWRRAPCPSRGPRRRGGPPPRPRGRRPTRRSSIWLSGGASHIDTWDLKPDAPAEYRGPFKPIATSAPGVRLCEHLPLLARQAHHLAVVNSLGALRPRHRRPPRRLLLQPHRPCARPDLPPAAQRPQALPDRLAVHGLGGGRKRPPHPYLPSLITLPQKPGFAEYTRPGQFAARLGLEYDPVYVLGSARPAAGVRRPGPDAAGRRRRPAPAVAGGTCCGAVDDGRPRRSSAAAARTVRPRSRRRRSRCWRRRRTKAAFDLRRGAAGRARSLRQDGQRA